MLVESVNTSSSGTVSRNLSSSLLKKSWSLWISLNFFGRQLKSLAPLIWKLFLRSVWIALLPLGIRLGILHFLPDLLFSGASSTPQLGDIFPEFSKRIKCDSVPFFSLVNTSAEIWVVPNNFCLLLLGFWTKCQRIVSPQFAFQLIGLACAIGCNSQCGIVSESSKAVSKYLFFGCKMFGRPNPPFVWLYWLLCHKTSWVQVLVQQQPDHYTTGILPLTRVCILGCVMILRSQNQGGALWFLAVLWYYLSESIEKNNMFLFLPTPFLS